MSDFTTSCQYKELSLKKSVSSPDPNIVEQFSFMDEIFGDIEPHQFEETKQIIKKLKQYNPRIVEKMYRNSNTEEEKKMKILPIILR